MIRPAAVAIAVFVGAWIAPPVARTALNVSHGLTTQSFTNLDRSGTRSFGYITVLRGGRYRFELQSGAPSVLEVAGSRAPERTLAAGPHFVLIEAAHEGAALRSSCCGRERATRWAPCLHGGSPRRAPTRGGSSSSARWSGCARQSRSWGPSRSRRSLSGVGGWS